MGSRLELQAALESYCANVYYQPPENIKLKYPCVLYHLSGDYNLKSNDSLYVSVNKYDLTVIDQDPESMIPKNIYYNFKTCSLGHMFVNDGLYHSMLHLYY